MKMTVLRKTTYKGYTVYVTNFGKMFQYLFADRNREIFQDHVFLNRGPLNYIKYKLGLAESPYTAEELEYAEKVLLSGAVTSIDKMEEDKQK